MKTDFSPRYPHCCLAALGMALAACAVLAHTPAHAAPPPATAEPIVIGQSLPLYGAQYRISSAIVAGAEAYLQRANAGGGIDGRPLRLVSLDDGGDPSRHAENVQKLIRESNAVIILNCLGDRSCRRGAEIAGTAGTPLVGPFSGARYLREPKLPFVFPVRTDYAREAGMLARQMVTLGVGAIAVVTDPGRGSEQLPHIRQALQQANVSFTIIEVESEERNAPEQLLRALRQGRYDAAILDVGPNIFQALSTAKLGQRSEWPPIVASLADPYLPLLVATFRGRTVGYSMVVPNPEAASIPLVREFQRDVERHTDGSAVSFAGLEAYINARISVEALRRARRPLSGKGVAAALETLGFLDLGGFVVNFQPGRPSASDWIDLGVISKSGFYLN